MIAQKYFFFLILFKSCFALKYEQILKQTEYLERCGINSNGTSSNFTQSPSLALIVLENMNLNLTGALISEKIILTRGSPFMTPKMPKRFRTIEVDRVKVFLGKSQLNPHKILIHPEAQESVNDIALIILETPIVFDDKIQPVCLWISSLSSNNFKYFYKLKEGSNLAVKCHKNDSHLLCDANERESSCKNSLLFLLIDQKWFLRGVELSCENYEEINLKTSIWILNKMFRDGKGVKWSLWMHLLALLTAVLIIICIGLATVAYNLYNKRKIDKMNESTRVGKE